MLSNNLKINYIVKFLRSILPQLQVQFLEQRRMQPCRREPVRWISSWKLFFYLLGTLCHKISDALVSRADRFLCHNRLELALIYQFYVEAFSLSSSWQFQPGDHRRFLIRFSVCGSVIVSGNPTLGSSEVNNTSVHYAYFQLLMEFVMRSVRIQIRISLFITFNYVLYFLFFLWYYLISIVR